MKMDRLGKWLAEKLGTAPSSIEPLASDGSTRKFFRVRLGKDTFVVMENPGQPMENDSYWNIGRHLRASGVRVPELYHYDRVEGRILLQDLGERRLQDEVSRDRDETRILEIYDLVLDGLLVLQLGGREGFRAEWCYQGATYDRRTILERESSYFLEAFLQGYCGWRGEKRILLKEFDSLARLAEELAPPRFLIHRDFQSRNILLDSRGRPGIVDFQGARLGPLQYDVASLIVDPYVDISPETRGKILWKYLAKLEDSAGISPGGFLRGYPLVLLHRNLQILGAFSFLGKIQGKGFFLQWIPKAFIHLRDLLEKEDLPCPALRRAVEDVAPSVLAP
jgi:aminoglycoside/choline kinase family phosphotransferase